MSASRRTEILLLAVLAVALVNLAMANVARADSLQPSYLDFQALKEKYATKRRSNFRKAMCWRA